MSPTLRGILLMLASAVIFAGMHGAVRHVTAEVHPFEVAFFRNLFGLAALAPWFFRFGFLPLHSGKVHLHLLRAVVGLAAMLAFFYGLSLTPLARAQALGFTAPLFATLLAIVVLGEKVRLRRWAALIVGFVGAMVIIRPGLQALDPGSLLVLGSAAGMAVTFTIIKVMARTDSSLTITAYMGVLMTPLSLFPALFVWQWPHGEQWLWLVGIGVLGTAGQMAVTGALRLAEATVVLPFDFTKLIWSALIGYLAFAEVPDVWTWVGGTIIFAGSIYITYRESHLSSRAETGRTSGPG